MESENSERQSARSLSSSVEHAITDAPVRRFDLTACQSLTSVMNNPTSSVMDSIMEYMTGSWDRPGNSLFLEEVDENEFNDYITKTKGLFSEYEQLKRGSITPKSMENALDEFYVKVPYEFSDDHFDMSEVFKSDTSETQEVLNNYLDCTDLCLFQQINGRWESFMSATNTLQMLDTTIAKCTAMIKQTIEDNEAVKSTLLTNTLKIYKASIRANNIKKLLERLRFLGAIRETQPTIQSLLSTEYFAQALELINRSQDTLEGSLRGIKAVKHAGRQLDGVRELVDKMVEQEFQKTCLAYVSTQLWQISGRVAEAIKNEEANPEQYFEGVLDESRLNDLIVNKLKVNTLASSINQFFHVLKSDLEKGIKSLILILDVYPPEQENVSKWDVIDHKQLIKVFKGLTIYFEEIVNRLTYLGTLILRHAANADANQSYRQLKQIIQASENTSIKEVVMDYNAVEDMTKQLFYKKFNKMIKSRSAKNSDLEEINEYFTLSNRVLEIIDASGDKRSTPMHATIAQLEKDFLTAFHDKKCREVAALVETETWTQVEIPNELLVTIADRRNEHFKKTGVEFESGNFKIVSSTLMIYKIIHDYVKILQDWQIAIDVGVRIVEILKLYNSKMCQMVLGAGATALGTIKTINSKHLGLSAQCLQFLLQEIEIVEHKMQSRINDYETLISHDIASMKSDMESHMNELFIKLSRLIIDRVVNKCETSRASIKWDQIVQQEKLDKDYYTNSIVSDLVSMHNILVKVLSTEHMLIVYTKIFTHIKEILLEMYNAITINSVVPAQRVRNDIHKLVLSLREKMNVHLQPIVSDLENFLEEKVLRIRCEPLLNSAS